MKKLVWTGSVAILVVGMGFAEPLTIQEWVRKQPKPWNTLELRDRANARKVIGFTPGAPVVEKRVESEKALRTMFRYVMVQAGIVKADLRNTATVRQKVSAWVSGLTAAQRNEAFATVIPAFWATYAFLPVSEIDVLSDKDDVVESEGATIPVTSQSVSESNGWGEVTGDTVEAVVKQVAEGD